MSVRHSLRSVHLLALLVTGACAAEPLAEPEGRRPADHAGPNLQISSAMGLDWQRPFDRPAATAIRRQATGFYRTEQIDGKWWFIDPNGVAVWGAGINGGTPSHLFTSDMWGNPSTIDYMVKDRALVEKTIGPGAISWVNYCRGILEGAGMQMQMTNAMDQAVGPLPSMRLVDFADTFFGWQYEGVTPLKYGDQGSWHDIPNVWHPDWEAHCDLLAAKLVAPLKDSPWVVGWFVGNERDWDYELPLAMIAWRLPADHTAKQAFVTHAQRQFTDIAAFNAAFGTSYGDWQELTSDSIEHLPRTDAGTAFLTRFGAATIDRFFSTTTAAVRKHGPNHLILGARDWKMLHMQMIPAHLAAVGKYCDVVSYNHYFFSSATSGIDAADVRHWRHLSEMAGGKPVLITEWGINAADTNCVMSCYQMVDTKQQRAEHYAAAVRGMAAEGSIIGNLWFCWDEGYSGDPDNLGGNGENRGWLRRDLKPYPELQAAATLANASAQRVRAGLESAPATRGSMTNVQWIAALPPVDPALQSTRSFTVGRLTLTLGDNGRITVMRDQVQAGEVNFQVQQQIPLDRWPMAERFDAIVVRQDAGHTVLDLDVAFVSGQGDAGMRKPGPCPTWSGRWRVWVPRDGSGDWFGLQNLSITNTSDQPWRFCGIFNNFEPRLGGSIDGDQPRGSLESRRSEGHYDDRAAGLGIGLWGPEMRVSCWRTAEHTWSSAMEFLQRPRVSSAGRVLQPGQTWINAEQPMAVNTAYAFTPGSVPPADVWSPLMPALANRFGSR